MIGGRNLAETLLVKRWLGAQSHVGQMRCYRHPLFAPSFSFLPKSSSQVHVLCGSLRFQSSSSNRGNALTHDVDMKNKPVDIAAADKRDTSIFTLSEYMEMEEKEAGAKLSLKEKASETLDNPMWILWGLGIIGVGIYAVVISLRIRREQKRFDPSLGTVRVLDNEDGPQIGGPFDLIDTSGKRWTDADLRGKWLYIYFGFTNCPDICPDEMRKMSKLTRALDKKVGREYWQPLFISIDPKRDTPKVLQEYLNDFHPRILGLTGTSEQTDEVARNYRVYYAVPDEVGMNEEDYLIDHSIVMYLMSPEGKFVDYTTKEFTWNESYSKLLRRMMDYEREKQQKQQQLAEAGSQSGPTGNKDASTAVNLRVANVQSVLADEFEEREEAMRVDMINRKKAAN